MININLTPAAILQIRKIYKQNPEKIMVFSMKTTGCSGFEYIVELENTNKEIHIVEIDNISVGIKKQYLDNYNGTIVDYTVDKFQSKFTFSNPNVKGVCGCGISVSF